MRRLSTREKYLIGVLVLLVGSLAYYSLVLAPLNRQRDELNESISSMEREIARRDSLLVQQESVELEIRELKRRLEDDKTREMSFSYILLFLEETAQELQVTVQGLNVDGVGPGGGNISMSLSGNYANVTAFMRLLQSDASGIVIDSARVTGQAEQAFVTLSANVVSGQFVPADTETEPRTTPFRPR